MPAEGNGRRSEAPCADRLDWPALLAQRSGRTGEELAAILSLAAATDVITFSGGFPAPETFPVQLLAELTHRLLTENASIALQYSPTRGLPVAREAVARLVTDTQGATVDPSDVLITSGGIEGLHLVTRSVVEPGDRVLVEAPTYLGAIMAFAGYEAEVDAVPVDADGLRVDAVETALTRGRGVKLLYVIPDHQNPTGLSLSEERRRALVDLCRRRGVLIVEDIAYRELAFAGEARPSLWSLGPDVVVQLGTFSKILAPGFRLGWAVGPAPLLAAMTAVKQNTDQCAGAFGQAVMAEYVLDGHLPATLTQARGLYRRRAGMMLDALAVHMPDGASWTRPTGGFFVWLTVPETVDTRALVVPAAQQGVAFVPGAPFYPGAGGDHQLRLSYSRVAEPAIDEGIRRLAALLPGGKGGPR